MRILMLLSLLVVSAALASAAPPNASFLANHFAGFAAARRGPAASDVLWEETFGFLDVRGTIRMPADARYPVASNTKLYTTIALYQLQERGLVDLEQPVQRYLDSRDMAAFGVPNATNWCPQVKGSADRRCRNVTFVQLMEMQAGIPNQQLMQAFFPYPGSIGAVFAYYVNLPLVAEPGTRYYYSNPAFILCGYFVEKFSGMRLADYYKSHIFDVVGMRDTYFDVFNDLFRADDRRIEEYNAFYDNTTRSLLARGQCTSEADLGFAGAAGGALSTPADEAKLYYSLFNFSAAAMGKPLLQNPKSLLAIVKPRTPLIPGVFYGQGIYVLMPRNASSTSLPAFVQYEGDLICPRTTNYMEVVPDGSRPGLMTQVWSPGNSYFTTPSAWEAARAGQVGVFEDIVSRWGRREGNNELATELWSLFNL